MFRSADSAKTSTLAGFPRVRRATASIFRCCSPDVSAVASIIFEKSFNYRVFFFTGPTPKSSKYKIMLEYLDWSRPKSLST